ncbi:hypothetical protein HMI56_004844, partial [Coelomomyces lativittatus]
CRILSCNVLELTWYGIFSILSPTALQIPPYGDSPYFTQNTNNTHKKKRKKEKNYQYQYLYFTYMLKLTSS